MLLKKSFHYLSNKCSGKIGAYCYISYMEHPSFIEYLLTLDNLAERNIQDMVMGKKAYLYCRNYEAVDRACITYLMFGACKVLGKNPAQ